MHLLVLLAGVLAAGVLPLAARNAERQPVPLYARIKRRPR